MKKRLLALLLVVTILASMIVMPAHAQQEQTQVGYCQHCKTVIPEEQWVPWDANDLAPNSGHYYLPEDMDAQEGQITISLDDDLCRNVVCLDLRGHSYTVKEIRPFLIYGIFSIMDSVGGGEMSTTGNTTNANGAFCQMSKKEGCVDGAAELNIYSGTIRRINTEEQVVAKGGLIYLANGSTLNVCGGKLVGGDVNARLNSSGNPVAPLGGTIYATGSNVNIIGGTVTGGVANDTDLTLSSGTVKTYSGYGGNIYAESNSKIVISGGCVENGYSDTYGGNICIRSSILEITGGTVTGGYSEGTGGNIMTLDSATFKMSGGVLKNGVCVNRGGNLFVNNAEVGIEINGGEIYGDLSVGAFKSFKLTGAPKIYLGLSNGLRLQAAKATKMDISGLTSGAEIYLDGVDQIFTGVLENPETYLTYFKDAIRADISVDESGALKVAQGTTGFCPHCWKTGEQATWTAWHNTGATSTTLYNENNSAHYYLTESITRKSIVAIGKRETVLDNDVVIDAAGKSWGIADKKLFNVYGTLSLMDSVGEGIFHSSGNAGANGGVIMGTGTGTFNMYSGTLARVVSDGEEMKGILLGGILYAPSGSETNVYGGTIRDGISASVSSTSTTKTACRGGNIYAAGTFTMSAGALIGGKAYTNSYLEQNPDNPILDSSGKATTLSSTGGNLFVSSTATITGGHIVGGNATLGGNILASGSADLSISNCVIRDGLADETDGLVDSSVNLSMNGGNLYIAGSSSNRRERSITNTIFRGGNAVEDGGNIYAGLTDITLRDCIISGGVAGLASGDDGCGGNLYLTNTAVCNMYDTTISNGSALVDGGNLCVPDSTVLNMHSGMIVGGQAKGCGGNVCCSGLNMYSGVITGGVAGTNGGNIYVYEGEANYLIIEAEANAPAPVVSNSKSSSMGGNIALGDNSTGTITGAIIENGKGDTANKYARYNVGGIFANSKTTLTVEDTVIRGIDADSSYGNGIYASGELILKGNTTIINEEKRSCIYVANAGKLTVDAGFTGEASVAFNDSHFANPDEPQGGTVAEKNTATGVFSGELLLEGYTGRDYGLPAIFAEEGDTKLYIPCTAVVDPTTGTIVWYRDNDVAAADVTGNSYLKLYKSENTLNLNRDLAVDLNGKKLTVSGTGTLYGFDTANDDYTTYGIATLTDEENLDVAPAYQAPNGNHYIAVTDENGTSFHRLGIRVSAVSVRPARAGVYYNGIWECDDVLKNKIRSFGMAVSVNDMPTAASLQEEDTFYANYTAEEFVVGEEKTSVMVNDIIMSGKDNAQRGTDEIYATLYTVINDGTENGLIIMGDDNNTQTGGVIHTMQKVMQAVDRIWPKLTDPQKENVKKLYNIDAQELSTWKLYNITASINGTASVRPLKILTLGHSLAVDSGYMLNMIASTEGYTEEFVIGTLYESGCKLSEHVTYLQNNSPVYKLYLSSTSDPSRPPDTINGITMKDALKYDDWDVIIMQSTPFEIADFTDTTAGWIQTIKDYVNLHKTNPNAVFAWHMCWATPTDNDLRDMYPKTPNSYYTKYAEYNDDRRLLFDTFAAVTREQIVSDPEFIYFIASGTAIENALTSYLVEKDLYRDYAHVSDLGRVIASYSWYCALAGIDHLDEIKLDAIPKAFLKSTTDKTQDRVLTEMEKAIILEAVNNTLANPLEVTESRYTESPVE